MEGWYIFVYVVQCIDKARWRIPFPTWDLGHDPRLLYPSKAVTVKTSLESMFKAKLAGRLLSYPQTRLPGKYLIIVNYLCSNVTISLFLLTTNKRFASIKHYNFYIQRHIQQNYSSTIHNEIWYYILNALNSTQVLDKCVIQYWPHDSNNIYMVRKAILFNDFHRQKLYIINN